MKNLNEQFIQTDGDPIPLKDFSEVFNDIHFDKVECHFRNLELKLTEKIKQFKDGVIFGSVAWLTSTTILKALTECENVQIVIQKEDFLRPDANQELKTSRQIKTDYHKLYSGLSCGLLRMDCNEPIRSLSYGVDPTLDAVRTVGLYNREKKPSSPRAHNKFLVFCRLDHEPSYENRVNNVNIYSPIAVWTGSFNLTYNATNSFENALYLEDQSGKNKLIENYLNEQHQILALSEPLNWEIDWIEPEFRIGT